jgi:hypothetical protein
MKKLEVYGNPSRATLSYLYILYCELQAFIHLGVIPREPVSPSWYLGCHLAVSIVEQSNHPSFTQEPVQSYPAKSTTQNSRPMTRTTHSHPIYDSTVTLAFALVTFTPSCFARPMMSTRLRAETACAILLSLAPPIVDCSIRTRQHRCGCA